MRTSFLNQSPSLVEETARALFYRRRWKLAAISWCNRRRNLSGSSCNFERPSQDFTAQLRSMRCKWRKWVQKSERREPWRTAWHEAWSMKRRRWRSDACTVMACKSRVLRNLKGWSCLINITFSLRSPHVRTTQAISCILEPSIFIATVHLPDLVLNPVETLDHFSRNGAQEDSCRGKEEDRRAPPRS